MTFSFTDGVQGVRRDAVSNGETDVHTHTHNLLIWYTPNLSFVSIDCLKL